MLNISKQSDETSTDVQEQGLKLRACEAAITIQTFAMISQNLMEAEGGV